MEGGQRKKRRNKKEREKTNEEARGKEEPRKGKNKIMERIIW